MRRLLPQDRSLAGWDAASSRALAYCERQQRRLQRWRRSLPAGVPDLMPALRRAGAPAWLTLLLVAALVRICVDFKPDPCVACAVRGYECMLL